MKKFFCEDCGANFATQFNLDDHGKVNQDDRKRTYKICRKVVLGLTDLTEPYDYEDSQRDQLQVVL